MERIDFMEFHFKSKVAAVDLWKLSMYHIYHSMMGVCNVIFTVAVILLTISLWNPDEVLMIVCLIPVCILFPVIQPVVIYFQAVRQVSSIPEGLEMRLNEKGLRIWAEGKSSDIPWENVRRVLQEPGMLILSVESGRGFMLTDKMLGTQKADFLTFVEERLALKNKRIK